MKGFGLGLGIMTGVLAYSAALYLVGFITGATFEECGCVKIER